MLTQNSSGFGVGFDFVLLLSVVTLCMQTMVLQYARWSVAWKTAVPWKLIYLIVVWFVRRRRLSSSSSSFVIPKKSSQLCTLLLARARARQMASGGFAISISGTKKSI